MCTFRFGRVLPGIGNFAGTPLRATEVLDENASLAVLLSNMMAHHPLHEWWILPERKPTWGATDNLTALLDHYSMCQVAAQEAQRLRELICGQMLRRPMPQEFRWYYLIRQVESLGPVIAIIFGDVFAMKTFSERSGLRAPARALS